MYGRTDKLYVKRYEEETNLRCQIIIDNSSSMYFPVMPDVGIDNPNKITFSVYAAAALVNLLQRQRDAVGLSLFSDEVELSTRTRSTSVHMKYLYSEMEKLLRPIGTNVKKPTRAADSINVRWSLSSATCSGAMKTTTNSFRPCSTCATTNTRWFSFMWLTRRAR